jgi:hypothetical protein
LTEEEFKIRNQRWKNGNNEIKKEAGRRQKVGYKRTVKERASDNIQTQNRV